MADFVLDASVTMAWCFPDESTPATRELFERMGSEIALVPEWWYLEVGNVLAMSERRKRISPEKAEEFIGVLNSFHLDIDTESPSRSFEQLLPLARKYRLTVYDAAYLDLAQRRRLPLATVDADLRKAAKKARVKILGK